MPTCPRCQQLVSADALQCPYCMETLKAYGHPGIPLHQAKGDTVLCETCLYHADDSCNYPQRPYAKTCTLYHNVNQPLEEEFTYTISPQRQFRYWLGRNRGWLMLLGLVILCVCLAIFN